MKISYIPNILTVLRLILIIPYLIFLTYGYYSLAFYLVIIAGLTDKLDGFLARKFQCISQLGAFLDPLADKLMLVSSFIFLYLINELKAWFLIVFFLRDLIIVLGVWYVYVHCKGKFEFKSILISKINTFLQGLLIANILLVLGFSLHELNYSIFLSWLIVLTSVISVIQYIYLGILRLKK